MRDVVETALFFSDCTEVPTSLWVESRICFAKQLVFEKDIKMAIDILRDICCILPPYDMEDLSFKMQGFNKSAGLERKRKQRINNVDLNEVSIDDQIRTFED